MRSRGTSPPTMTSSSSRDQSDADRKCVETDRKSVGCDGDRVMRSRGTSPSTMTSSSSRDQSDADRKCVETDRKSVGCDGDRVMRSRGTSPLDITLDCSTNGNDLRPVRSPLSATCYNSNTGNDDDSRGVIGDQVATCLSSLGYELECVTPVDEEPPEKALLSGADGEPVCGRSQVDDGLSGLDVLSRVASSQVHEDTGCACPRRRFSILDIPLSQFMEAASVATAASGSADDEVTASYNVPSADDCALSGDSLTRAMLVQQQNSSTDAGSTEQRSGDVFTTLRLDVGKSHTDRFFLIYANYMQIM